jgi:hypothetical protein
MRRVEHRGDTRVLQATVEAGLPEEPSLVDAVGGVTGMPQGLEGDLSLQDQVVDHQDLAHATPSQDLANLASPARSGVVSACASGGVGDASVGGTSSPGSRVNRFSGAGDGVGARRVAHRLQRPVCFPLAGVEGTRRVGSTSVHGRSSKVQSGSDWLSFGSLVLTGSAPSGTSLFEPRANARHAGAPLFPGDLGSTWPGFETPASQAARSAR